MTDERIDALVRRLDASWGPDAAYVDRSLDSLMPRARAARRQDTSVVGAFQRRLRPMAEMGSGQTLPGPMRLLWLMFLLVLAMVAALVVGGGHARLWPSENGSLLVSIRGQLEAVEVRDGLSRALLPSSVVARGVSRSPDGREVAYWTIGGSASHLHVVGVDGRGDRVISTDPSLTWVPGIDTWSSDSRSLAAEVMMHGSSRILVADIVTGATWFATPDGVVAHSPLWSPDDRWLAFVDDMAPLARLGVVQPDGSDLRIVSREHETFAVDGANNWSPDGRWVYFGATALGGYGVFRVDVTDGSSQRLTTDDLFAVAPALSPDGSRLSFIVDVGASGWDLYAADPEGAGAHRVLAQAMNLGWSADSQFLLTRWFPPDRPGGLAVVRPDGTDLRVVVPLDAACQAAPSDCLLGLGWGQPRP